MQLARIALDDGVHLARIDGEEAVLLRHESDHPAADALREALAAGTDLRGDGRRVPLTSATRLAPVRNPSKILAIGRNYADHARESNAPIPAAPIVFSKPPSAIVGPGEPVVWDAGASSEVDYEVELAAVIGRRVSGAVSDPLSAVLGYTICNDVSARDAQYSDGQWVRAKSFDTFCPLGPVLVTADAIPDPQALGLACTVSGEKLQDSSTAEMIFPVAELITYLARFITLEPGDVIATGTPDGVGFARQPPRYLRDGDVVTCWVEGIGELTNPVVVRT